MRLTLTALAALSLGLPLIAGQPATPRPGGINWYSIQREMALGKQLSEELERQVKLADDPILSEYVNRLAQNLARQSDISMPVTVRIIESGDINAFSLPGGHIYMNSGMLKLTESEAELVFVLAHELGHVAARHATREATRDQLAKIGSIPVSILGGWTGAISRELVTPGSRLGLLKGERDFENEADRLGVDLMNRTGYDPQASVDMLERVEGLERKTPGRLSQMYGTHPMTAARIDRTQKHISEIADAKPEYIVNTSEYEEMRVRAVELEAKRVAAEQPVGPVANASDPR